ncbi:ogr/Delta-like zinc finger family protein [Kushneria sp. Sum13]|uniref:ogr/Delta-like zinc finger family protein n=1 Tax=Kushneria sp. Sum13 TaxID=3459196 RepID=UPI00404654F4
MWTCKACNSPCRIRTSKSPLKRLTEVYADCQNPACGARWYGYYQIRTSTAVPQVQPPRGPEDENDFPYYQLEPSPGRAKEQRHDH